MGHRIQGILVKIGGVEQESFSSPWMPHPIEQRFFDDCSDPVGNHKRIRCKFGQGPEETVIVDRNRRRFPGFDQGWGTAYLARLVGERKAREIWFLCRRYKAQEAVDMGLINKAVPHDQLDAEVAQWCKEINEMSPTALTIAKRSFNADSENIRGIGFLGIQTVKHYYQTEESKEGVRAFNEKRKPDYKKFAG